MDDEQEGRGCDDAAEQKRSRKNLHGTKPSTQQWPMRDANRALRKQNLRCGRGRVQRAAVRPDDTGVGPVSTRAVSTGAPIVIQTFWSS